MLLAQLLFLIAVKLCTAAPGKKTNTSTVFQITLKKLVIGPPSANPQLKLVSEVAANGQVVKIRFPSSGNMETPHSACKPTQDI